MTRRPKTSEALCAAIERFWAARGYTVKCRVKMTAAEGYYALPVVRSDMVNGLPRGMRKLGKVRVS